MDSPLGLLLQEKPQLLNRPKAGDLLEAVFIGERMRTAYFDLKKTATGIVYGLEFLNASDTIKKLRPGEMVLAKVIEPENDQGYTELSLAEADKQKDWQVLKELKEKNEALTVKITGANTGGLLTALNETRAFIPVSQLGGDHYPRVDDGDRSKILEELKKLIGLELKVKILDLNPATGKLILSEKELASPDLRAKIEKYRVGDLIEGVVSGVADFGAFVKFADHPAIEGLIHISELDHRLIENPKEIVGVGDNIKAKILEIKDGRISLSLKATKPNPWESVAEKFQAGAEVTGSVSRFNPFGAFIALTPDIQGLIHISEFGSPEKMRHQLELGKSYFFQIELIKPEEKRIILKLKR